MVGSGAPLGGEVRQLTQSLLRVVQVPGSGRRCQGPGGSEPNGTGESLRDLVNATVGFEALANEIHKPAKSLHRVLSKSGNPTMSNISAVFAAVTRALKLEVRTQVAMT